MAEFLVAAASCELSACTFDATATITENATATCSVSTHIYDAAVNFARKVNTISGVAIVGISLAGFEIVDI